MIQPPGMLSPAVQQGGHPGLVLLQSLLPWEGGIGQNQITSMDVW